MFFLFRGGRIHYSDLGSGPVIVLLYGYPEAFDVWNGFEKKLASELRLVVLEKSGHPRIG